MTGLLRKATLLASVGVLAATSVMAAVPFAPNCTVPCGLALLVKNAAGNVVTTTPVGGGPFRGGVTVIVRDQANNPIAGSLVCINFTGCGPVAGPGTVDVKIADPQLGGLTVDCLPAPTAAYQGTVCGVTDGSGQILLKILGGASNPGGGSGAGNFGGAGYKCGVVFADGVNLGTVNVATYDGTGNNVVNSSDITDVVQDGLKWAGGAGPLRGRADFDCNNQVGSADITAVVSYGLNGGGVATNPALTYCN